VLPRMRGLVRGSLVLLCAVACCCLALLQLPYARSDCLCYACMVLCRHSWRPQWLRPEEPLCRLAASGARADTARLGWRSWLGPEEHFRAGSR
jgi:hypothetical protein